ncbi:MAG TPA: FAD-dependent oxidoreductase, partial [Nitrososphaeraceae archaeon]|nr:FAD-dependent oxidoreductase [Nitrososphaeraceae archaeon]
AGTSAASKAKRLNPNAQITILQDEPLVSYGACGMPYVIEGLIDSFEKLIERPADEFKKQYDIDVLVNTRAEKINPFQQKVYAISLTSHKHISLDYDSLVIATGARPFIPPIRGVHLDGVVLLRNYGDGKKIKSLITNGADSAIIVGAGLIGLEMAESFKKNGIDNVTIVEMADHVLPNILDEDLAKIVEKHLQDKGVRLRLGEKLVGIFGGGGRGGNGGSEGRNGKARGIKTTKGSIESDLVLLGTGVRPNSEIARDAGIDLGYANAIKVDEYMRTNISNIFAAGDCATAKSYVTGKDTYLPLGTTANKQGRIAGENAAGGNAIFRGIAGSAISKSFDLYFGKTGLSFEEALKEGFEPTEETIESITRSGYYPNNKPIWIKIISDKKSNGRVLGSQIVGGEGVKGRIDLVALALLLNADIADLAGYDACYVPPASPVWEPINIAASQVIKTIKK